MLTGHSNIVTSLAFTAQGRQLVSGSVDNTIRLWDPDRAPVSVIGPLEPLRRRLIALNPNGELVATAGSDGFIRVWERRNPSQVTAFQRRGPKAIGLDFTDLTFTTDGSRLVVLGPDEVRVWDPLTAEALTTRAWPEPLRRASLLPDGQRVIELTTDGALRIWNVEGTDAPANLSPGFERPPEGPLVASFNNERIAVGTARQFGLWDVRRRRRLMLVDLNALDIVPRVGAVALSSDGGLVASGHEDGTIRFWDVASGRMLQQFMGHDGPVQWLVFNPIGTRLVSAAAISDRKVRIWRAHPQSVVAISNRPTSAVWIGEPLLTLEHENAVQALAMSTDGTTIATLDTSLHLWNGGALPSAEARLTAELLRERWMTLQEGSSTSRYADAHGDNPEELRVLAWYTVSAAGRPFETYTRAVTLAESAQQGAPYLPGGSVIPHSARPITGSVDTPRRLGGCRMAYGSDHGFRRLTQSTWRSSRWHTSDLARPRRRVASWIGSSQYSRRTARFDARSGPRRSR